MAIGGNKSSFGHTNSSPVLCPPVVLWPTCSGGGMACQVPASNGRHRGSPGPHQGHLLGQEKPFVVPVLSWIIWSPCKLEPPWGCCPLHYPWHCLQMASSLWPQRQGAGGGRKVSFSSVQKRLAMSQSQIFPTRQKQFPVHRFPPGLPCAQVLAPRTASAGHPPTACPVSHPQDE